MINNRFFLLIYLCLAPFLCPLLSAEPSEIDNRLASFMDMATNLNQEGLLDGEIVVARNNQILLHLQSQEIDSMNPQFMIGSVSKQFFSVALLKALYESSDAGTDDLKIADVKNKLNLPISYFLPRDASVWEGEMPAWANQVTLHHLLSHTSGIPNYSDTKQFSFSTPQNPNKGWFELYHSPNEVFQLISKQNLSFPPGTHYSYSNTGYLLIAEVLESITHRSSSEYIQHELLDPIGLSSTKDIDRGRWDELKQDPEMAGLVGPFKYDPSGDDKAVYPLQHYEDMSIAKGAASLISTSSDLLKWNKALHKEQSVLPNELYKLLITENLGHYGYGISAENTKMGLFLGHDGAIGTYRTFLMYMPEYDISIVVLSNISNDFDIIDHEYKSLMGNLRQAIPDEKACHQSAQKIISEKYTNKRGWEMIFKKLTEFKYNI